MRIPWSPKEETRRGGCAVYTTEDLQSHVDYLNEVEASRPLTGFENSVRRSFQNEIDGRDQVSA